MVFLPFYATFILLLHYFRGIYCTFCCITFIKICSTLSDATLNWCLTNYNPVVSYIWFWNGSFCTVSTFTLSTICISTSVRFWMLVREYFYTAVLCFYFKVWPLLPPQHTSNICCHFDYGALALARRSLLWIVCSDLLQEFWESPELNRPEPGLPHSSVSCEWQAVWNQWPSVTLTELIMPWGVTCHVRRRERMCRLFTEATI